MRQIQTETRFYNADTRSPMGKPIIVGIRECPKDDAVYQLKLRRAYESRQAALECGLTGLALAVCAIFCDRPLEAIVLQALGR